MSPPWMPLYVADYLADTGHLSAAEHGAYLLLIMHYWRQGSLPTDESTLARIARMNAREWSRSSETLAAFFDAEWKHERIETELRRANVKSSRRSEAGARGGNAKALKNKTPAVANASELPSKSLAKPLASSSQPQSEDISLRSISKDISLRSISRAEIDLLFARFWQAYPKRTNRKTARSRFETAIKAGIDPEKIISAAVRYAEHVRFTEPQFIKAPDAWLNAGKWDDELPAEPQRPPSRAGPRSSTNGVVEMLNELNGVGNVEPDHQPSIRDITPAAAPEPGGCKSTPGLFESPRKPSRGEVLNLRPNSSDTFGQTEAYRPAWRTG